ncbi:MAG: hypothetical protein LCH56_14270 [Proteobacteria bacterium]|nr:hypothetical protein [Pseudomonadota bacterium]
MTPDEFLHSISEAERGERAKRGLPVHHVLDMAEFPFVFATSTFKRFAAAAMQWANQEPDDPGPHSINTWARVLMGDYVGADKAIKRFQALRPTEPLTRMRFAETVPGEPVALPPVAGAWPVGPAFFIGCDPLYLRQYGLPLLRSIAAHAPGAPVHVHVMGQDCPSLNGLHLQLTVTTEDPSPILRRGVDAKMYYHAARLVRFTEALRHGSGPLVMADADALVTADPRPVFSIPGDVTLRVRAGRIEPWHHFSACLIRGTSAALPYFESVADIIRRFFNNPFWGLDQYALFAAYIRAKPNLTLFGPDLAGVLDDAPGVFWFTAGAAKKDLASSETPFAKLYRRYSTP